LVLFAHDTKLLVPEKEEGALQHTEELQTWFKKNYDNHKKRIKNKKSFRTASHFR
jgi:hypothetical protein